MFFRVKSSTTGHDRILFVGTIMAIEAVDATIMKI